MPNFEMPTELVSIDYVCRLFTCSRATVYRWIANGHLPAPVQIGPNKVGFPANEIKQHYDRLLAARVTPPAKEVKMRFRIWNNRKSRIFDVKGDGAELLMTLAEHGSIEADSRACAALLSLRQVGVPVVIRERNARDTNIPMLYLETAVEVILADVAA